MSEVKIELYRFSGKQGLFTVPDRACPECDLMLRNVFKAIELTDRDISLKVKPWFLWFWKPLFQYGSWHPPILIVGSCMVCQGIVPKVESVLRAIEVAK